MSTLMQYISLSQLHLLKFLLLKLVFTFEQINHNQLRKTLEMIQTCCYCNEAFSANIIQQILIHVNNSSFNEIKQVLALLYNIIVSHQHTFLICSIEQIAYLVRFYFKQLIEDPLQLKRLRLAIDGYKHSEIVYNGLLSIVRQNQSSDAKKSYQCVKFIVTLANRYVISFKKLKNDLN